MSSNTVEFDAERAKHYNNEHFRVHAFSNAVSHWLASRPWYDSGSSSSSNLRILDYGCGNGITALKMAQHGHLVTGVDVSADMLDYFEENVKDASEVVRDRTTILHVPSGDGSTLALGTTYDLILVALVLHHVAIPEQNELLLSNLTARLQPSGRLVVVEFEKTKRSQETRTWIQSEDAKKHKGSHHHRHDHEWITRDMVVSFMQKSGLEIAESEVFEVELDQDHTMDCFVIEGIPKSTRSL